MCALRLAAYGVCGLSNTLRHELNEQARFKVAFVTRWSDSDACWRLQQHAIVRGAAGLAGLECRVFDPGDVEGVYGFNPDFVGFHYGEGAVDLWRSLHTRCSQSRFVCFGSDIYDFGLYTRLEQMTDLFVMPTKMHAQVLSAHVSAPVAHLVEPVDPLVGTDLSTELFLRLRGKRVGWFGYPESFEKSMYSLLPVIEKHLRAGNIDTFTVLTDASRFNNPQGFDVVPFRPSTFAQDLARFDYVILSHFPLDLRLNSYIKSPNKAMAALASGVVPLASDTPSYRLLMEELDLTDFLFGSPRSLDVLLSTLDPVRDSRAIRERRALEALRTEYCDQRVARDFCDLLSSQLRLVGPPHSRTAPLNRLSYGEHREAEQRLGSRLSRAFRRLLP